MTGNEKSYHHQGSERTQHIEELDFTFIRNANIVCQTLNNFIIFLLLMLYHLRGLSNFIYQNVQKNKCKFIYYIYE